MNPFPYLSISRMIHIAQCRDRSAWENFLFLHAPNAFLQSWDWGQFQAAVGARVFRFVAHEGTTMVGCAQVVEQRLGRSFVAWYVGSGPVVTTDRRFGAIDDEIIGSFVEAFRHETPRTCIFLRCEPDRGSDVPFRSLGFRRGFRTVRPKHTLVIDLDRHASLEELLQSFKQKTRYNIRLAAKRGVRVRSSSDVIDVRAFLWLFRETTARDAFHGHDDAYYETLFTELGSKGAVKVFLASVGHEVIAANVVLFFGDTAFYLFGASGNAHRELMAPHLLQWETMCYAQRHGFRRYDLFGVAPLFTPAEGEWAVVRESDLWAGVTRFKLGFVNNGRAGRYVSYPETQDLHFRSFLYTLLRLRRFVRS